jgi:hypothetical protein
MSRQIRATTLVNQPEAAKLLITKRGDGLHVNGRGDLRRPG